jgi:hypothetical protein
MGKFIQQSIFPLNRLNMFIYTVAEHADEMIRIQTLKFVAENFRVKCQQK